MSNLSVCLPVLPVILCDTFRLPLVSYFRYLLFICASRSMPLASYFRVDHLILQPTISLASYFRAIQLTLHPSISLASYFRADHLTLHPTIRLASYFCYSHPYIGMGSNILLWIHLSFIWAPIFMYWMIIETGGRPYKWRCLWGQAFASTGFQTWKLLTQSSGLKN